MDAWAGYRAVLTAQDGVIERAQAIAAGLTRGQFERLVRSGELVRVYPRVYRTTHHAITQSGAIRAVVLWLGPDAVLVDQTAAWWWDLPVDPPPRIEVTTGSRKVRYVPSHAELHRYFVDRIDLATVRGIRVQSRPLAAIRAAAELEHAHRGTGLQFLDRCIQLGVSHAEMTAALARHVSGRGNYLGRRLLFITGDGAESAAERKAGRILHLADIDGWTYQYRVRLPSGPRRLDIAIPELRIGIEVDGFAFHHDQQRFVDDRQRDNDLRSAGWWVIHVTWHDLHAEPERFVGVVQDAIAARSSDFGT